MKEEAIELHNKSIFISNNLVYIQLTNQGFYLLFIQDGSHLESLVFNFILPVWMRFSFTIINCKQYRNVDQGRFTLAWGRSHCSNFLVSIIVRTQIIIKSTASYHTYRKATTNSNSPLEMQTLLLLIVDFPLMFELSSCLGSSTFVDSSLGQWAAILCVGRGVLSWGPSHTLWRSSFAECTRLSVLQCIGGDLG